MENLEYIIAYFTIMILHLAIPIVLKAYPPKSINAFYGYRTKSSMLNEDTWQEANTYFSKNLLQLSLVFVPLQIVIFFLVETRTALTIALTIFSLVAIVSIILTEKHLNSIFDKSGQRNTK
ncbi:MAG: SdpI family protein [Cytophagales bacterium]|nr:MAG: SdpI family protein [Cytophagales bacterium]